MQRYYSIGQFYKERFGQRVYKIPVTIADTCPNRLGLKGMQTCIFCDEWGSAADNTMADHELDKQIEIMRKRRGETYNVEKFLLYFQAYTSTFTKLPVLKSYFEKSLEYPEIVGIVIGTRPDCLSKAFKKVLQEYAEKTFVSVEVGVQSFDEDQVDFLKRGHTAKDSIKSIYELSELSSKLDLGIHLMFGLPGETDDQMIETAEQCNQLPIHNVKLHNLHVLKNTPLADMYLQGTFQPIDLEDYSRRVRIFLEHLDPRIAVQRLAATAPRWDELIAPEWTKYKMKASNEISKHLASVDSKQGLKFSVSEKQQSGI